MKSHTFSSEELEQLRDNPWVSKVASNRIYYTKAFIRHALKRQAEGFSAREIFLEAGIPLHSFNHVYAKDAIKQWRRNGRDKDVRPGRPKKAPDAPEERLRYLEAQVAYLKAENAFLVQLRAGRAE